ncbi:MAG: plasmid segregation centromere-binding protein ParR [Chlorogloeopsis fritschii C42_A2020_084]|uniref:plasmid segregation centromere-binding protein ParR n=1 Tax=Chlorogloeopsis fritschii TaxID=1124 RepID=UPI001A00301F|nr:plasmid segregation centromere-binding protein ParR [Chlorogloeopsis fritschii]MBF2007334.1 plasmid segregation centromere-binding protein ParR [Chlorogloeopsis fritschii C42_A2020_084]
MFQWSKKVVKSVTFNPGVADESLLTLVESHLEKEPEKTFSDLCKEALWQSLCVPESVRPNQQPPPPSTTIPAAGGLEPQIADLQSQLADLEERFFANTSHRLEMMERHLMQLSQQVAQLGMMVNKLQVTQTSTQSQPVVEVLNNTHNNNTTTTAAVTPPQEVDPLISRLSQYLDDF